MIDLCWCGKNANDMKQDKMDVITWMYMYFCQRMDSACVQAAWPGARGLREASTSCCACFDAPDERSSGGRPPGCSSLLERCHHHLPDRSRCGSCCERDCSGPAEKQPSRSRQCGSCCGSQLGAPLSVGLAPCVTRCLFHHPGCTASAWCVGGVAHFIVGFCVCELHILLLWLALCKARARHRKALASTPNCTLVPQNALFSGWVKNLPLVRPQISKYASPACHQLRQRASEFADSLLVKISTRHISRCFGLSRIFAWLANKGFMLIPDSDSSDLTWLDSPFSQDSWNLPVPAHACGW